VSSSLPERVLIEQPITGLGNNQLVHYQTGY